MIHYKDDEEEEEVEGESSPCTKHEHKRISDMLQRQQRLMSESGEHFMVKVINIVQSGHD